jgi:hypothetical protein
MDNIAKAFNCINHTAHIWAEDFADEAFRDYPAILARFGQNNRFYRAALEEMQWQAGAADLAPVPDDFEIEF